MRRIAGREAPPVLARVAEPWLVDVLDPGGPERLAEPPLREAGLARHRVQTDVDEHLDVLRVEDVDHVVDALALVADRGDDRPAHKPDRWGTGWLSSIRLPDGSRKNACRPAPSTVSVRMTSIPSASS